MLKLSEIHTGAEVYWTDPCEAVGDEHSSGYYRVLDILAGEDQTDEDTDIIICIQNEAGSFAEVFNSELS